MTDNGEREAGIARRRERREARRQKRVARALERARRAAELADADKPGGTRYQQTVAAAEDAIEMGRRETPRKRLKPPPVVEFPASVDELVVTDRYRQPLGHALRDWWRPCVGFLVCGGPSINALDMTRLRRRGVCSLAVNNVAGHVRTNAFTFSDPPEKFHHGIFFDPSVIKFVPISKLYKRVCAKLPDGRFDFTRFRVCDCPAVFGYQRTIHWEPAEFLKSQSATWGLSKEQEKADGRQKIRFTFFLGLRLLHYLGCRRVYLLGCDFNMNQQSGYAFAQQRHAGSVSGNNTWYRLAAKMCDELKPHFDADGYEIFNCNPESRLTTWPYVSFDDALADASRLVPDEPFDLAGWYEKRDRDPNAVDVQQVADAGRD